MSPSFSIDVERGTLCAAREGDEGAREQLFRQFERPVYTLALRICHCPQEALDVLQDTFIKAFDKLGSFRADAPFWAWLRQIAVNTALSRLRAGKRWLPVLVEPETDGRMAERVGHRMDLHQALGRLTATTRAVVWLHDVEGYTHREIGRLMGRTTSFSKTQLMRGHQRLRELLGPDAEDATCHPMTQNA